MQYKSNKRKAVSEVANEMLYSLRIQISPQTVRNRLYTQGFHERIARRKPYINSKNRIARKKWAKEMLSKPYDFWKRVIFTDESKFNLFESDGMVRAGELV